MSVKWTGSRQDYLAMEQAGPRPFVLVVPDLDTQPPVIPETIKVDWKLVLSPPK